MKSNRVSCRRSVRGGCALSTAYPPAALDARRASKLFAIAILVIMLGQFGMVFTAGREISIRWRLAASDDRFRAASESAGVHGGAAVQAHSRLLTYIVYALMAAAVIAPGSILVYASWDLVR